MIAYILPELLPSMIDLSSICYDYEQLFPVLVAERDVALGKAHRAIARATAV